MRRWWMGVTGLMMIAACRTEGTDDRMLRTQRKSDRDTAAEQQVQAERGQSQTADRGAQAVARIFSMIQAMNQEEIETSKLAQARAASPDVKAYAGKLVTEHQLALDR